MRKNKNKIKIASIILARSGSKGLKNKNLSLLDGKPLIYYAIEAAKSSSKINRVFVSTDSKKIASVSRRYGAEVPFMRKKKYAGDFSTTEETLVEFLKELKLTLNYKPDIIVYFQATDIFRKLELVKKCVENLVNNKKVDSSFIVTPLHKNFWHISKNDIKRINKNNIYLPRQKKTPIFREDTGLCLATRSYCINLKDRIGKNIMPVINTSKIDMLDIHTLEDLKIANSIIKKLKIKPNF